jgi:serine/threonine protein kinase
MGQAAAKVESFHTPTPQLETEARIMDELQRYDGFPTFYAFLKSERHEMRVLVMEKLGASVESIWRASPEGRLPLVEVLEIGRQALRRLETLHTHYYVHRDIKPENLIWGSSDVGKQNMLFLIDYGLSKQLKGQDGRHIPDKPEQRFVGSPRFASIHAHDGRVQSRRDDLEALTYSLVALAKGTLPWQNIELTEKEVAHAYLQATRSYNAHVEAAAASADTCTSTSTSTSTSASAGAGAGAGAKSGHSTSAVAADAQCNGGRSTGLFAAELMKQRDALQQKFDVYDAKVADALGVQRVEYYIHKHQHNMRTRKMVGIKTSITPHVLCSDLPPCFRELLEHARRHEFAEMPDYWVIHCQWKA